MCTVVSFSSLTTSWSWWQVWKDAEAAAGRSWESVASETCALRRLDIFGENEFSHPRRVMCEPTVSMLSVQRFCWAWKTENLSTPLAANDRNDVESDAPKLDRETSFIDRSIVGALLYTGHDRGDAAYAIRLLVCDMCHENEHRFRRLKRVVWFFYHTRELAVLYHWSDRQAISRKSSSCAVLQVDGCVLSVICRGQQIRAQSSAEAEVYAQEVGMNEMLVCNSFSRGTR